MSPDAESRDKPGPAERPRILVTNDDGIDSEGIHILARGLLEVADVLLVAPQEEKSGVSHAITLGGPVQYRELDSRMGLPGYVVMGTPVDCVRFAFEIAEEPFDMIVSGINSGANVGINIHYSGTVAAALEAAIIGCAGLAVSISSRHPENYETAAALAADLVGRMHAYGEPVVLNLNVPDLPLAEIRGVRVTRTSLTEEETVLAIGENCLQEVGECEGGEYVLDSRAVAAGFVSVTPLQLDLTARDTLKVVRDWEWRPHGG